MQLLVTYITVTLQPTQYTSYSQITWAELFFFVAFFLQYFDTVGWVF